ncbi:hypothetical protein PIB30_005936 [Stylosanthes scabra]|uniref:Uncharacterized protein n=1 Tax=Stylosanthes scabra TaxID=79078 RepID=A0ABU6S3V9_9FABA|nr:hypothetical protein [Stylosanthes scabra]
MFGWLDALCGDELDCDRICTDAVPPLVCAECVSPFGDCYKLGFSLKLFLLAERSGPVCGLCGHYTFSMVVRFLGACSRNQAKEFDKFWNILELENHVIFARLTLWRVMTVFLQVSTMAASPRDPVAVAIVIVAITIFCDSRFCLPMESGGVKLLDVSVFLRALVRDFGAKIPHNKWCALRRPCWMVWLPNPICVPEDV